MQDFNLSEGAPIIEDDVKLIWQQVDLLFDTYKGQLFGDIDYGTDYEHYLYDLNVSAADLVYKMEQDLELMDLRGYSADVRASLYKGSERDIALIQVNLEKNNATYSKTFKIV